MRTCGTVTSEVLLQSEWRKLTGSGADTPEVTGVIAWSSILNESLDRHWSAITAQDCSDLPAAAAV